MAFPTLKRSTPELLYLGGGAECRNRIILQTNCETNDTHAALCGWGRSKFRESFPKSHALT
eukprot:5221053-Prymnesium_polylepis.1